MEHNRLNALVYVKYNTGLHERSIRRKKNLDPIVPNECDSDDEWIVEKEDPVLPKDSSWLDDPELFNVTIYGTSPQSCDVDISSYSAPKKRKNDATSSDDRGKQKASKVIVVDEVDEDVEEDEGLFDSGMFPTTMWVDSIDHLDSAFQDDDDDPGFWD